MMDLPIAGVDLPEDYFPIDLEIYGRNGELLWSHRVEKPDKGHKMMVKIPSFGSGGAPRVVIRYANGEVDEQLWEGEDDKNTKTEDH